MRRPPLNLGPKSKEATKIEINENDYFEKDNLKQVIFVEFLGNSYELAKFAQHGPLRPPGIDESPRQRARCRLGGGSWEEQGSHAARRAAVLEAELEAPAEAVWAGGPTLRVLFLVNSLSLSLALSESRGRTPILPQKIKLPSTNVFWLNVNVLYVNVTH